MDQVFIICLIFILIACFLLNLLITFHLYKHVNIIKYNFAHDLIDNANWIMCIQLLDIQLILQYVISPFNTPSIMMIDIYDIILSKNFSRKVSKIQTIDCYHFFSSFPIGFFISKSISNYPDIFN